jgi:UDP-GlcNAc3NAcA epimerase
MRIVTIIGARPQIIKAAAISRAIKNGFKEKIVEVIVHTGQHYDENMSQVFFNELGIPPPDYNLNTGSGTHGKQTASMLTGIEEILIQENPSCLLVYGDTNSTLAGAIAASKLHIPIVHIEAGLRSFNKQMPEEINRILCDHVSSMLFAPTQTGLQNLMAEGFGSGSEGPCSADNPKVFLCGDIMYDNSMYFSSLAKSQSKILQQYALENENYLLATIHRDNNTDNPERLSALFKCFDQLSRKENIPLVLPLHPRTAKLLEKNLDAVTYNSILHHPFIKLLPPASFLEMIALEMNAKLVLTDSGGVQKEAYFFNKPCIILRPETEWVELVDNGTAIIADANPELIEKAYYYFKNAKNLLYPKLYGDGHASEFICEAILKYIPETRS